jgi:hypothetical protein
VVQRPISCKAVRQKLPPELPAAPPQVPPPAARGLTLVGPELLGRI